MNTPTPTPEQVAAAMRVADGIDSAEDRRTLRPSVFTAYSDMDSVRVLAANAREVAGEIRAAAKELGEETVQCSSEESKVRCAVSLTLRDVARKLEGKP